MVKGQRGRGNQIPLFIRAGLGHRIAHLVSSYTLFLSCPTEDLHLILCFSYYILSPRLTSPSLVSPTPNTANPFLHCLGSSQCCTGLWEPQASITFLQSLLKPKVSPVSLRLKVTTSPVSLCVLKALRGGCWLSCSKGPLGVGEKQPLRLQLVFMGHLYQVLGTRPLGMLWDTG